MLQIKTDTFQDFAILRLSGEFSIKTLGIIKAELQKLLTQSKLCIALDIKEVNHVDSSAFGLLANFQQRINEKHGYFCLFNVSQKINESFQDLRLGNLVPFFSTEQEFRETVEI